MLQLTRPNPLVRALEAVKAERVRRELRSQEQRVLETKAQEAKQDLDAVRERCKTLRGFVKEAWPILEPSTPLVWGWHLDAICDHLQAVTEGTITDLLMCVPPGSMKSLTTAVFFPAYEWGPGGKPALRYLTTSYELGLASRDNLRMRRLITSDWYKALWGESVILTSDQRAKLKFENTASGVRDARPFASITGGRGDRVIVDDPHNTKMAESDVQRGETVRLAREALPSRGNTALSAFIIMMQRLNRYDVAGLIEDEFDWFEKLIIPMEFEPERRFYTKIGWTDPRTKNGALMAPKQFTPERVRRLKKAATAYSWASQYQQRPTPREGGMFKPDNISIVEALPAGTRRRVRAWDLAATKPKPGIDPDYTVGVLMSMDRAGFIYIEDVVRGRWSSARVRAVIKATKTRDGTMTRIRFPQDPGQAGKSQAQDLVRLVRGSPSKAQPVRGDKTVRADGFAAQVEIGNVYLLRGAWNREYLDELRLFPAGHDDQVDASSDAFDELSGASAQGWFEWYEEQSKRRREAAARDGK